MIHPTAIIGGTPETRGHLRDEPIEFSLPPVVAPSAHVGPFVTVDAGTSRPTVVSDGALLLAHSHIGHDAHVWDRAEVCTGAVIGGHAEIGEGAKIGLNATVLPYRKVGPGAVIGAGAVVDKDVPAGETWAGVPARKLEDARRDPRTHTERRSYVGATDADHHEAVRVEMERMHEIAEGQRKLTEQGDEILAAVIAAVSGGIAGMGYEG
jgi:UDP-3-O-[3-hydroxymyristoyl] glucosamine N-acyltransferase